MQAAALADRDAARGSPGPAPGAPEVAEVADADCDGQADRTDPNTTAPSSCSNSAELSEDISGDPS